MAPINPFILQHYDKLAKLCEAFGVEKLYAFGSVVTDRFDKGTSDLDFLAVLRAMPPIEKGEALLGLWDGLESLFGLKIDLITDKPITNPYFFHSVESSKRLIYDRTSQEIPH